WTLSRQPSNRACTRITTRITSEEVLHQGFLARRYACGTKKNRAANTFLFAHVAKKHYLCSRDFSERHE
ncbi:MAG: hypothetical protein II519_08790, partial [Muribaculaceae bacterium]|nr:hypothetical protein [Muribaculaceae bacterium]